MTERVVSTTAVLSCERCGEQLEVELPIRYTAQHTVVGIRPFRPWVAAHLSPVLLDPLPPR